MSEEQDSTQPDLSEEQSAPKPVAKKATKKAVKKATKKAAKKAVKKAAKKAAKKAVKKAAKKAAKKVAQEEVKEADLDLGQEQALLESQDSEQELPLETTPAEILVVEEGESPRDSVASESQPKEKTPEKKASPPPPPPEVPEQIDLNDFRESSMSFLYDEVERLPVRIPNQVTCAHLVFTVVGCYAKYGTQVIAQGVVELSKGRFGMLRDESKSFRPSPDDLYVHSDVMEQYNLREGQRLKVEVRAPGHRDQYLGVQRVLEIDGQPIEEYQQPTHYDDLTSLFPEERFVLEADDQTGGLATRVVDLVSPLGKGQRGLIVAPPRGGKTILLKQIARAIQQNHSEAELIILLLDERPEEVTDFEDMVGQSVFASTFDEPSIRHAQVANLVLERARRLVEQGKDVVVLLDSLTRLARGYNNAVRGGPIGSGGISPRAISETRKFFGAARNVEQGGSLTILATCLIETESRMDDVIFEELKGTGNMEVRLDRELAEQRVYPAIHIPQSGTRNDDRLYHPDELPRIQEIRRHLASLPIGEAIEVLLKNLARTKSNTELLLQGMR
jgi:transcription termination factor Rho